MKLCSKCNAVKVGADFYQDPTKSTGLSSSCRECTKDRTAAWIRANKEKKRAADRAYGATHREELSRKHRAWREANRDHIKATNKRRHQELRGRDLRPKIYFIQVGEDGPIKIGFTELDVSLSLAQLQSSHWQDLRVVLIVDGDRSEERRLHERFASLRIAREWFMPIGDLADFVSAGSVMVTKEAI